VTYVRFDTEVERVFTEALKDVPQLTDLLYRPRMRFHDLRHTSATLLLGRGVHPKVVSEMLGHTRISTTLDLYSHVSMTMQQQAADAFDAILGH
jgi:site-specific recombinase XerD